MSVIEIPRRKVWQQGGRGTQLPTGYLKEERRLTCCVLCADRGTHLQSFTTFNMDQLGSFSVNLKNVVRCWPGEPIRRRRPQGTLYPIRLELASQGRRPKTVTLFSHSVEQFSHWLAMIQHLLQCHGEWEICCHGNGWYYHSLLSGVLVLGWFSFHMHTSVHKELIT